MAASESRKRAVAKYIKEKTDEIKFRVPKGQKSIIKSHADNNNESMTEFIKRAIRETMERDKSK